MTEEAIKFGAKIRELRLGAGMSLRELAQHISVDFTYLSKIESGTLPPPSEKVILRLAEVLNGDKDELLVLAGKVPSDILEMLKERKTLELLRARRRKAKARSMRKGVTMPMSYKMLARVALAVILSVVVGTSFWFTSPQPAAALTVALTTANSPVSGTDTYLLGERIRLPSSMEFVSLEEKDFDYVRLQVSGPESFTKDLPFTAGTYNNLSGVPGDLDVVVTWDTGISGYGYRFGYGYSPGNMGKINYDIRWQPPYALTSPPTQPPAALPATTAKFDISLPGGASAYAGSVQGLAYGGTPAYLYILNYANYAGGKDVILRTDLDGTVVDYFAAPGNSYETEAITFVGSTLYAAYNRWDNQTFQTKGKIAKYESASWSLISGLSTLDPIGGLASDGTNLFIAYRDSPLKIEKRNPTTGAVISTWTGFYPTGGIMPPPIWGFNALAYGSDLYAAQNGVIIKVDPSSGAKTAEYMTTAGDIRGLEFVSESWGGTNFNMLYLATWGYPNAKVYRASKVGEVPTVENTPVGSYTAQFRAVANSNTYTASDTFTLGKLTAAPTVTISAPTAGFAVTTGAEAIAVTGSINDPSIAAVTVGIALPLVTAFADTNATTAKWQTSTISPPNALSPWFLNYYTGTNLWHRSTVQDHTGDTSYSWRYAKSTAPQNYDTTGQANSGALRTKDPISIGDNNTLSFWTWYDSELDFWPDRKWVEVSTDGSNWTLVKWLAKFWPPFIPPDPNITQQQWATLTNVPERTWTKVDVSLAAYAGQSIYIRFRFDTMDDWGNAFEGWYIDDVSITGAGFLGASVAVNENLQFSTTFTLAEGSNVISVSAARTNYAPLLTGTASVTGSLDSIAPTISLDTVVTPTNLATQVLTGRVTEANFDRLTIKVNTVERYSTTVLTPVTTGVGSFSATIPLTEGANAVVLTAIDKAGLSVTTSTSITRDSTGPVFEDVFTSRYKVSYMTGEVSARVNDLFVISLKVTDAASGVRDVRLQTPNQSESQWPTAMRKADIPGAVIDSWGVDSTTKGLLNYLLPMQLPTGLPAGDYTWTVIARDLAGNSTTLTVTTTVVTTLQAFNIYLLPDWNLVSTPVIPTNTSNTNISTLTSGINATGLFERAWYYDASAAGTAAEWKLYVPGVTPDPTNPLHLTKIEAGKGYWFKMANLAAFDTAGKVSDPMATGLPRTPAPIKLTIAGQVLSAGAVTPPTYTMYAGWNLVGLHSEVARPVSTALQSVTVPTQKWGSVLEYLNYISFPREAGGQPQIDLGRFNRLISTDSLQPGRGFWLYMVEAGVIVP